MAETPCALQCLVSQTAKCPTDYERNPTHAKLNAQNLIPCGSFLTYYLTDCFHRVDFLFWGGHGLQAQHLLTRFLQL